MERAPPPLGRAREWAGCGRRSRARPAPRRARGARADAPRAARSRSGGGADTRQGQDQDPRRARAAARLQRGRVPRRALAPPALPRCECPSARRCRRRVRARFEAAAAAAVRADEAGREQRRGHPPGSRGSFCLCERFPLWPDPPVTRAPCVMMARFHRSKTPAGYTTPFGDTSEITRRPSARTGCASVATEVKASSGAWHRLCAPGFRAAGGLGRRSTSAGSFLRIW